MSQSVTQLGGATAQGLGKLLALPNLDASNPFLQVPLVGNVEFAGTLGAVTLSSGATIATGAALSVTLGALTLSSTASFPITANASNTLGALSLSSTGSVAIRADSSKTLGAATVASTGAAAISAVLSSTLGAVVLSSDATGGSLSGITADLAQTLGALTLQATATVPQLQGATSRQTIGGPSTRRKRPLSIANSFSVPAAAPLPRRTAELIATLGVLKLEAHATMGPDVMRRRRALAALMG